MFSVFGLSLALTLPSLLKCKQEKGNEKSTPKSTHLQMQGTEFPMSSDGRTYHLGTKKGEVARRIICVGDLGRAERYATFLDKDETPFKLTSSRGFLTITGKYKGVPVTIL